MSKVLTLFLLSLLVACSSKIEEQDSNSSLNSFTVGEIAMTSVESTPLSSDWKDIPSVIHINLKTCLTDKILFHPLINESLEVGGDGTRSVVLSDMKGCISWKESLAFNFFEKEKSISFKKIISGLSVHKGSFEIPLSINPWSSKNGIFRDLRYDSDVQEAVSYESFLKSDNAQSAAIYVQGLSISYKEDKFINDTFSHNYHLQADLKLKRIGKNNELLYVDLLSGKYQLVVEMYQKIRKTGKLVLLVRDEITVMQNSKKLESDFNLTFDKAYSPNNIYQVAITLIPLESSGNISPVTVIMPIQNFYQFNTASLEHKKKAEIDDQVINKVENKEDLVKSNFPKNKFGFTISNIDFNEGPIKGVTFKGSSERTRMFGVKFTVLNPADKGPIKDSSFKISMLDPSDPAKTIFLQNSLTTVWGVVNAQIPVTYDMYAAQEWKKIVLVVEALDDRFSTEVNGVSVPLNEKRLLSFNPWMTSGQSAFDIDREVNPEEKDIPAPRIFLNGIDYQYRGNLDTSYQINSNLNLSLKKQYQIKIKPQIQKFHDYAGERPADSIVFGDYQLEFAIFVPNTQDLDEEVLDKRKMHLLTVTSKKVTVKPDGEIETMIELPFWIDETSYLSYKLIGVVVLKSLDKKTTLKPAIETFPFFGLSNGTTAKTHYVRDIDDETKAIIANIGTLPILNKIPKSVTKNSLAVMKEDKTVEHFELKDFNARSPLNNVAWNKNKNRNYDRYNSEVSDLNLKMLTSETAKMPNAVMKNLCRHFYQLPTVKEEKNNHGHIILVEVGGRDFNQCLINPGEYIETRALQHVLEILGKQKATIVPGLEVKQATLVDGMSYSASSGERDYFGTNESSSISKKVSWNMDIIPPLLFDFSLGKTASWEVGETAQKGKSSGADTSFSVNTSNISLSFDRLVLGFNANIMECVLIKATKNNLKPIHLCRNDSRPTQLHEKWFFVGKTDSRNHSVISDATEIGDGEFNQCVRGEITFNRMWAQFKESKSKLMLRKIKSTNFMEKSIFEEQEKEEFALFDNTAPGIIYP